MIRFIDDHRHTYGVEPICRVLPIAPSTYFRRKAEARDPTTRSARAQRDDVLRAIIRRIWEENHRVYGPRKVWKQMWRDGLHEARCRVRRLMREMGPSARAAAGRGRPRRSRSSCLTASNRNQNCDVGSSCKASRRALKRLRAGLNLQWEPVASRDELHRR